MRKLLIILVILQAGFLQSFAQDTIEIKLAPQSIKVGEKSTMTWTAKLPTEASIILTPELPDSFPSGIEVLDRTDVDSLKKEGYVLFKQKLDISAYDSGRFAIPILQFAYLDANADTQLVLSDSAFLNCSTVAIDTTQAIKDVKDIYEVDYKKPFPWWIVFLALGLIALGLLIYFLIKRRKKRVILDPVEEIQLIDPVDEALAKLNKIKEERSWTKVNAKIFFTQITDIIRRYLERQFQIEAEEMVSSEIMDALRKQSFSSESENILLPVLRTSDFVKFAKYKPSPGEFEDSLSKAINFVLETRPRYKEEGGEHASD